MTDDKLSKPGALLGLPYIGPPHDNQPGADYVRHLDAMTYGRFAPPESRVAAQDIPTDQLWATAEDIINAMGSQPLTTSDRAWLQLCVRAANSLIRQFRPDLPVPQRGGAFGSEFKAEVYEDRPRHVEPTTQYGITQLVLEMYRRRGMVQGENATAFGDFGPPPTSLSFESQMFLRLGRHQDPVIA